MDMDSESITEQEMISSANSSRASTPTPREDLHSSCILRKQIEKELKTYTDSIDHCQTLKCISEQDKDYLITPSTPPNVR
ncbi:hypothetical protein NPIL_682021 [Nephila pilipes]|uniref:Uncharacterized protein n=1 Tax=Nephila pilipes TaxID=299642 RepID=A0A8X6U641_NEPPI|nr:hypothetical protein NPIL_682021 [Nephila pilipes]